MANKYEQLPLPEKTIEIKTGHKTYEKVDKLPAEGHVRITVKKTPSRKK